MKFWQKVFISTLIVFIVLFDIAAFLLVSYSYDFSLQREKDNVAREQAVILSSVKGSIGNAERMFPNVSNNKVRLRAIIEPLAKYYENQDVYLALYDSATKIYSNAPKLDKEFLIISDQEDMNMINQKIDGKRYLFVVSKMPEYTHLTFVYARDISQLDRFRADISQVFIRVSNVLIVILCTAVFVILKRLTRPLLQLNSITRKIAEGAYDKRVNICRNDEFGELGDTFNSMADSVEDKVKELIKSTEDKQHFIDNLAHEMKTPLTSIMGYSEYLQKAMSKEEERMIAAGHLHDAAQRLHNLSIKLLDMTYMRSGEIELKEVDIEALFASLEKLMLPILTERKLCLITNAKIKFITGEETLLLSLLTNLVENAARASSENKTITVSAYMEECPIIEVADNGCGMNEEEIEKITEPFYRVDKSRSRAFGGLGLGLSIAVQIADLHSAKIEIKSQKEIGTYVKLRFIS